MYPSQAISTASEIHHQAMEKQRTASPTIASQMAIHQTQQALPKSHQGYSPSQEQIEIGGEKRARQASDIDVIGTLAPMADAAGPL